MTASVSASRAAAPRISAWSGEHGDTAGSRVAARRQAMTGRSLPARPAYSAQTSTGSQADVGRDDRSCLWKGAARRSACRSRAACWRAVAMLRQVAAARTRRPTALPAWRRSSRPDSRQLAIGRRGVGCSRHRPGVTALARPDRVVRVSCRRAGGSAPEMPGRSTRRSRIASARPTSAERQRFDRRLGFERRMKA